MDTNIILDKISNYVELVKSGTTKCKLKALCDFAEECSTNPKIKSLVKMLNKQTKTSAPKRLDPYSIPAMSLIPQTFSGPGFNSMQLFAKDIPIRTLDNKPLDETTSWKEIELIYTITRVYKKIRSNCQSYSELIKKLGDDSRFLKVHNALETNKYTEEPTLFTFTVEETEMWNIWLLTVFNFIKFKLYKPGNLFTNAIPYWDYDSDTGYFCTKLVSEIQKHHFRKKFHNKNIYKSKISDSDPFGEKSFGRIILDLILLNKPRMRRWWTLEEIYNKSTGDIYPDDVSGDETMKDFIRELKDKFREAVKNINEQLVKLGMKNFLILHETKLYTITVNPIYTTKRRSKLFSPKVKVASKKMAK